jgi:hypothetical protein
MQTALSDRPGDQVMQRGHVGDPNLVVEVYERTML